MLKHALDKHEADPLDTTRYGIKVLKYTRTPFERQIRESVYLQGSRTDFLLNSKSEYNRCSLPRLTTKLGEKEIKEGKEEEKREKRREDEIGRKIREMKIERSKKRREPEEENQSKRRRVEREDKEENSEDENKEENPKEESEKKEEREKEKRRKKKMIKEMPGKR